VNAPDTYELRVGGHLDEHWSAWFGDLALIHQDDGTTTLRGPVADQAELHGLLAKIRDLGIPLLSVNPAGRRPRRQPPNRTTLPTEPRDQRPTGLMAAAPPYAAGRSPDHAPGPGCPPA
jgi:hypothetical protein